MGKIMRNGKKYSGASSSMAENIIYDNTESGLEANDVQGAIDELSSNVDEQNKKFEWKFAGSVTGTTPIVTPKNFRELLIDIKCPTSDGYTMAYSFIFNKKQIENGADYFNGGAIGESKLLVQITVNLENIILRTLVFTTNNITDTATVSCYYR